MNGWYKYQAAPGATGTVQGSYTTGSATHDSVLLSIKQRVLGSVMVGGVKKEIANLSVIVGGVKKPAVVSVIDGGVKKNVV